MFRVGVCAISRISAVYQLGFWVVKVQCLGFGRQSPFGRRLAMTTSWELRRCSTTSAQGRGFSDEGALGFGG